MAEPRCVFFAPRWSKKNAKIISFQWQQSDFAIDGNNNKKEDEGEKPQEHKIDDVQLASTWLTGFAIPLRMGS